MTTQTIWLTKDQVPSHLRAGYSGTKFRAIVVTDVCIPSDAGLWTEGSRDTYRLVRLADGHAVMPTDETEAPWGKQRHERNVTLESGFAVIQHSTYRGKDMGLHFHVHPSDAAVLLPAPAAELSDLERMVLETTRSYKSSYGGKDRYQMATDDLRYSGKSVPTRAQWDEAKGAMIARGYLTKAGAITVAGRNAI